MGDIKCINCGWPEWVKDGPEVEKIICGSCRFRAELAEMDERAREKVEAKKDAH